MRVTMATIAVAFLVTQAAPALSQDRKGCANPKDNSQAIRICSEIIRSHPNDAAAYSLRGDALARNGDLGQAIADYSKAIQINANYAPAYDSRASAYTNQGDYTRAVADATKAAELAKMGQERRASKLPKIGQETHGMVTVKTRPKNKTSAWASKKQAQPKQETPAFNPFEDRGDTN